MHHARRAFCAVLNEDPSISAIHCFDVWATLDKLIYIVVERILRTAKLLTNALRISATSLLHNMHMNDSCQVPSD